MNYNLFKVNFQYGSRHVNFSLFLNIFLKIKFIRITVVFREVFLQGLPCQISIPIHSVLYIIYLSLFLLYYIRFEGKRHKMIFGIRYFDTRIAYALILVPIFCSK